ncbi:hypothetical protein FDH97_gp020 [Erwinia phage vB_EamM_Deimos-Minion]|uniref:Putative membrane protein n=1 Tax=Erwinia phage vB_EamM_Deimos-Minion TaxID=1815986 RepID=A0A173GF86_9CAUD|nr:hypothetical protein FDH97_gp020 [Erwinia phage vB_EamM_Deimos-Minion]ANH52118.2 putative membrane protein [Erwinia phage vB_EamM_Deimos-Minion]
MSSNLVVEPGSWGEFYASIEALTWKLQNSRYSQYDLASTVMVNFENDVDDLVTSAQTLLASHQARRDNVHQVNAEQLGFGLVDNFKTATVAQAGEGGHPELFVTPQGFNALASKVFADFGSSLHHQGINPISSFGSLSFLPPDVSGSFEGSGQVSGNSASPMIIEDDGTLVGLRYGTTGTTEGLYYFYLPTAEDRIDNASVIRTNFKYAPANLPAGAYCTDVYNTESDVLLGNIKGSSSYNWFISITNGTFDATKHNTAYFTINGDPDLAYLGKYSTALVVNGYVYIFGMLDDGFTTNRPIGGELKNTNPIDMVVWRVAVSSIINNNAVTLEKISTWSTKDIWGDTTSNPRIQLSKMAISENAADKPYVQVNGALVRSVIVRNAQRRLFAVVDPSNPNRIRLAVNHTFYAQLSTGSSYNGSCALSLLLDLTAKTAVVEDNANRILVGVSGQTVTVTGNTVLTDNLLTGSALGGNWHPNVMLTSRGYLFCRTSGNQPDENPRFSKGLITNFTTRFEAMRIRSRQVRQITLVTDPLVTGTALTNNFMKPQYLAGNALLLTSNPYKTPGYYAYGTTKRVLLTGSPTFNYTLNSGVTLQGWAPNSNRYEITDANNPPRNRFYHIITQVDSAGNVTSSPSVLSDGSSAQVGTSIDANLNITGSITFNQAELNTVAKAACQTALGAAPSLWRGLIYVPQDTAVPLIMVCTGEVLRSDGNGYRVNHSLVELTYTGARSGNITGYTVKRVLDSQLNDQQPTGVPLELACNGGLNIYKTAAGDYLLGIGEPTFHQTYGGIYGYVWYAAIKAGTGTIEDSSLKTFNHGYYPTSVNPTPVVVPGYGLCVMDYQTQQANANALMIVDVMAATYAEFVAWTSKRKLVLTAQQVEQGYLVYFTAPTQVFMAGNEYTLPAGNIDLRTITANPASKTFYVYVQLVDEQVQYLITLDQLAPTITLMYIGKITTNTTQISSIAVDKRIRIETFELSATHIGSGIPITTGVPSTAGNFAWRNGYLKLMSFAMQLDYNGIVTVNLRTGAVTIEMSVSGTPPDSVSRTRTQTVWSTGETWVPGLVTVGTEASGASDAFNTYASTSKTFPALARSDIANSTGLAVMMGNESNPTNKGVFTQQPSAANDYTLKWKVTDTPGGAGEYTFDLYVKY